MVKLALSFATLAAVVATVTSVPLSQSPLMSHLSFNEPNKCIPETKVLEYHPFYLKNIKLNSLVSKKPAYNLLVGGIKGEKSLDELELCIVSTDFGCSKTIPSNCIFQNVQYRFRVNSPVKGYLKVVNGAVEIVDRFQDASELNLYKEAGWGLRVAQGHNDENRRVFSTTAGGHPLILEKPIANKASQWFEIVASDDVRRGAPSPVPSPRNKCIPETSIKEYHPFALLSSKLQTLVSKSYRFPYLVGGVSGSKAFQQLDFCIVSTTQECSKSIPSNCIYENVEYRFRVNGPVEGYLRIVGDHLDIVPNFKDGSGLNLYKEAGWGLRVAHVQNGHRTVLATNGGGRALTMEEFKANDARQWFQIVEANPADIIEEDNAEVAKEIMTEQESCFVPSAPNKCVPETSIKEYQPFALLSSKLQTLVSRPYKFPYLVGGVRDDSKAFQQLEFCIVSTTQECSKSIPSNCIYENVEYRFRVNGPVEGYLRIVGGHLDIVPNFKDGSGLNLYKEAGWGLRVAHVQNGHRTVLATNGGGFPLSMEELKANDARQWFQIVEANSAEKPYRRF